MKRIALTKGEFALVDDADFEWLNQWKWCYVSSGYAMRREYLGGGRGNEKARYILMHRIIADAANDEEVDHINRNKLDNQRDNLRLCDSSQNKFNTSVRRDNKSGVRGVSWYKAYQKWTASIKSRGTTKFLGYFDSLEEAVEARKQAERQLFGEFADVHIR